MTGPDLAALRAVAVAAADAAGRVLLAHQAARRGGAHLEVTTKSSPTDPVSEADRAAERAILAVLADARPDDGVLGEEAQGDRPGTTGLRWVVDPLDGTVNYVHHLPQWAVSVAVEDHTGPVVGCVLHPDVRERFVAVRGGGAVLERPDGTGHALAVQEPDDLASTLVATGFAYDTDVRAAHGLVVGDWLGRIRDLRRGGSAALDLAHVAAGRLGGYVETGLQPWDLAAGQLLVTEAGGVVAEVVRPLAGRDRSHVVAGSPATVRRLVADLLPGG